MNQATACREANYSMDTTITTREGSSNRYNNITAWISTAAATKSANVEKPATCSREATARTSWNITAVASRNSQTRTLVKVGWTETIGSSQA